ncbi:hypothetical protein [Natrinema halophilum]|uniref:PD(D/E)XK endonuclease domain-containing protein n=1 Tax=Natrinema halophilum TaxID=1699371 RepID=A0A7D5KZW1_9EURY|nr:hypothetical protein [Natrinema halophilum]QLG50240.1 hypothetical protein HYG82_15990 [Natrinema halophilum]
MTVSVEVPPRYARLASKIAKERNQSFEENDGWNNESDTWRVDPEERQTVGALGEIAFAIYANLQVDTEVVAWSDGGVDFEASIEGVERTIDVKTSQKDPHALPVKEYRVNADYYVLGHLEGRAVTFLGTATKEMVLNGKRRQSRFDHYNYLVPVSSLNPVPDSESIVGL